MTDQEWAGIVAVLTADWPHQLPPDEALQKWRSDLDDLPAEQVLVAVEVLYREGREFPPNGGQIRRQVVVLDADLPRWSEVWGAVIASLSRYGMWDERGALGFLASIHPLAAMLVREIGYRNIAHCDTGDLPTIEAQCRRKWDILVERFQRDRTIVGLPTAGLRALERAQRPELVGGAVRGLVEAIGEEQP